MNRAERRATERHQRNPFRGVPRHRVQRLGTELNAARAQRRMQSIPAGSALNHLTLAHGAINRLISGAGTDECLIDLLIVAYTAHELARAGYAGPETTQDIARAGSAIASAQNRANRIGRYGLNGEELAAMRELVATYDAQLNHEPRPTYDELLKAQAAVSRLIDEQMCTVMDGKKGGM